MTKLLTEKAKKKALIDYLPDLVKLMKTADTLNWSIDEGTFEKPGIGGKWATHLPDGNISINIEMYHKKNDERLK